MPLTPQDVANKTFSAPKGRRDKGYDEDQVDAFLDEVEAELTRLLTENADLRNRLNHLQTTAAAPAPVVAAAPAAVAAAAPAAAAPVAAVADPPEQAALRTLQMAQRTADSAIAEAKAEADRLVSDATAKASALERDAQARHVTVMGQLDSQRVSLEAKIEDLRAFEREYRTRLKAYLETQLRDLDGRAPADAPAAAARVPAGVAAPAAASAAPAGVPGLAAPAPAASANPYAPRPAGGNPFAVDDASGPPRQAGFETDDEGPEPSTS